MTTVAVRVELQRGTHVTRLKVPVAARAGGAEAVEAALRRALNLGTEQLHVRAAASDAPVAELRDGDELRVTTGRELVCRFGAADTLLRLRVPPDTAWPDILRQLRLALAPRLSGLRTNLQVRDADGFALECTRLLFDCVGTEGGISVREVVRLCCRVHGGPALAVSVPLDPAHEGAPGVPFPAFCRALAARLLVLLPQRLCAGVCPVASGLPRGGLHSVLQARVSDGAGFVVADMAALLCADGGAALEPGARPEEHPHPHDVDLVWSCSACGLRLQDGEATAARLVSDVPLELTGNGTWGQRLGRWLRRRMGEEVGEGLSAPVYVLPGGVALQQASPIAGPDDVTAGANGAPPQLLMLRQRLFVDGGTEGAQLLAVPAACATWAQLLAMLVRRMPPAWRLAELGCLPAITGLTGDRPLLDPALHTLPPHDGARLSLLRTALHVHSSATPSEPPRYLEVPLACVDAADLAARLVGAAGLAPAAQVTFHVGEQELTPDTLFRQLMCPAAAAAMVAAGQTDVVVTVGPAAVTVVLHCGSPKRQVPCELLHACTAWADFAPLLVRQALGLGPEQAFVVQALGWGDGAELSSDADLAALRVAARAHHGTISVCVVPQRRVSVRTPMLGVSLGGTPADEQFEPVVLQVQVPHTYGGGTVDLAAFEKSLLIMGVRKGTAFRHNASDIAPDTFGAKLIRSFVAAPRVPLRLYAEQPGAAAGGAAEQGAGAFTQVQSCDELADGATYHLCYACAVVGCTGANTSVCRLAPPAGGAEPLPPCSFACRACLLAHVEALTQGEYVAGVDVETGAQPKHVRNPVGAGSLDSSHFQFANGEKWHAQIMQAYYDFAHPKHYFECPLSLMDTEVEKGTTLHCHHTSAEGVHVDHRFDSDMFAHYLKSKIDLLQVNYDTDLVCPHPIEGGQCKTSLFTGPDGHTWTNALVVTCLERAYGPEEGARLWARVEKHNRNQAYAMCPKCDEPQDIARWMPGDAARTHTCRHAACAHRFCSKCCADEHEGINCEEYRDQVQQRENTQRAQEMRRQGQNIKQCPRCHIAWVKGGECQHFTCEVRAGGCGLEFCWDCLSGAGDFGRPVEETHGNAFHQNECRQFLQCCAANCMVEHDQCQNGNHAYNPERCPACRAAGQLCARATPKQQHQRTYFAVGQLVTYYDQDAVRPIIQQIKGMFGGAWPDREQANGTPAFAQVQARAEREGRKRATVLERGEPDDSGLCRYTVQLETGGAPLDVSTRQISHLVADSGIMAKYPECKCDSCLWVVIDDAETENGRAEDSRNAAIIRAGVDANNEMAARRIQAEPGGLFGDAGADEVKGSDSD